MVDPRHLQIEGGVGMTNDPTRRALRAVANISLTIGLGGCIHEVPEVDPAAAPDVAFMLEADSDLGALDAEPDADVAVVDAADADASVADGGADALVCENSGSREWAACCDAVEWDWRRVPSCSAWGPPVPPTMEVA